MIAPDRLAGVILAGGGARRMGGADKALIALDGLTLLARVLDRLEPQVARVALSSNRPATDYAAQFGGTVLADDPEATGKGPLAGVLAALRWAGICGASHVASVAVDSPFFPLDLVARLARESGGQLAIARSLGRDHPTFGLWPVALAPALAEYLAVSPSARMLGFLDAQAARRVDFAVPEGGFDPFVNLNTPDDLAFATGILAAR